MDYSTFKEKYHIQVDKQQEKAVKSEGGPVLVLSVPGSGKTTTIVSHVGYLVYCLNVDPRSILVLTYNKSAQLDLKDRMSKVYSRPLVTINTVHAFCYRVISEVLGKVVLIQEWEKRKILRAFYQEYTDEYPTDQDLKSIEAFIEYVKSSMMSESKIEKYVDESNIDLSLEYHGYKKYQEELKASGKRDFNDLEIITCNLFYKRKDILTHYQNRFQYICVDEAQDISMIQHKIIDLLARNKSNNLFMVGDEDQSIYRFRAAYPEALLSFQERWENASIYKMETNYRSIPSIVKGANRLIKHNTTHLDKKMKAYHKSDEVISYRMMKSRIHQYEWLCDYIITESTVHPDLSIAILYRDNDSIIPLIDLLDRKCISFTVNKRLNSNDDTSTIFHTKLVDDLKKVVELSSCLYEKRAGELFKDLAYRFDLHIPKDKIINTNKYVAKCIEKGGHTNILEVLIQQNGMSKRNIQILETLQEYLNHLSYYSAKDAIKGLFNNLRFYESMYDIETWKLKRDLLYALGLQVKNINELLTRIDELSNVQLEASQKESKVFLSTIHSAKGLEFDQVIVIDMVDPIFPKYNIEDSESEIEEKIEEERNLAYVAITRAKSKLTLLEYKDKKSTFIHEIRGYKVKRK